MQTIEAMLDELEAAADAVEAYGAARPIPWRLFLGDDVDSGAFVSLTPDQTRRLVAIARAAIGGPRLPAQRARLFPWPKSAAPSRSDA